VTYKENVPAAPVDLPVNCFDTTRVDADKLISETFFAGRGANNPESWLFVIDGLPIEKVTVSCPVAGNAPVQTPITFSTAASSNIDVPLMSSTFFTLLNISSVLGRW